jgi:hypothetical protein
MPSLQLDLWLRKACFVTFSCFDTKLLSLPGGSVLSLIITKCWRINFLRKRLPHSQENLLDFIFFIQYSENDDSSLKDKYAFWICFCKTNCPEALISLLKVWPERNPGDRDQGVEILRGRDQRKTMVFLQWIADAYIKGTEMPLETSELENTTI